MELLLTLLSVLSFYMLSADTSQNFPSPLSKEEEKILFEEYGNTKDPASRMKLIEHNIRLVAHIVRKYYGSSEESEDLISIGTLGLIKAVDSFKISSGTRFATYAAKCIQNEILMYFRGKKKTNLEVSINSTIDIDREGNPLTYMDVIKCDDTIADDLDKKFKITKANKYINTKLDEREKQIIKLRYGLGGNDPMTQRETAECLGISRSYVSRIEKAVLEKLSSFLRGESI